MKWEFGCSRMVLLAGNYAFKFPNLRYGWKSFLTGLLHNISEKEWSKVDVHHLCKIKFSIPGGFLNVMPRATVMTEEEHKSFDIKKWSENNEYLCNVVEDKNESFGWLNGKVVAIDYGHF